MRQNGQACGYRDFVLEGVYFGYPELCALPNGRFLASTWNGVCLEIDPDSGKFAIQSQIAAPGTLSSPTASLRQPTLCSAATRVSWTALWELGGSHLTRIETEGPVNCVALSPQGDLLAAGLGMYPLDPSHHPHAAIELFSTVRLSESIARRVLPGVAIDRVVFHPSRDVLIAVTGARGQDRGHVLLLDRLTLNLLEVVETDFFSCRAVMVNAESDHLTLAYREGVQVRSFDQLWNVEWEWRASDELFSAAHDSERDLIFLSNGQVLSPDVGEVASLPALHKCTGLTLLRDGRLAGISQTGVFRVWETRSVPS